MRKMMAVLLVVFVFGCSAPLTTREKGAGLGALGGAGIGAIIGNQSGNPGAGAAIGGLLGLGAGALIGDQLQKQEEELKRQQEEIERLRRENRY